MSKRNKSFTYVPRAKEPLVFDVQPMTEDGEPVPMVSFTCLPTMPAGVLIELGETYDNDSTNNPLGRVVKFFNSVLIEPDVSRFQQLIDSKLYQVPFETLTEIMEWLIEEYTARPTKSPTSSDAGPTITGNGSMADSSPLASTQTPSPPPDSATSSTL